MTEREGFTLIEMVAVLGMLGIILGIAAPPVLRWRDAAAVHSARDELAAVLALTRVAAVSHGGASLWVDATTGRVWIASRGGAPVIPTLDLAGRYGIDLETGSPAPVELRYDAFGIGRIASRTLTLRRHHARAGLTISAYGRYRRW
jgi:prepilin-type N-terminal cleavage/methylation domain-containing protein